MRKVTFVVAAIIAIIAPGVLQAQTLPDQAALATKAMKAVRTRQFPASRDQIVVAYNEDVPLARAAAPLRDEVARRLGTATARVRDVVVCTAPRRCRLPKGRIYMGVTAPRIRGDSASIVVEVWSSPEGDGPVAYRAVLVTARRSGGAWVVVAQEVQEIS